MCRKRKASSEKPADLVDGAVSEDVPKKTKKLKRKRLSESEKLAQGTDDTFTKYDSNYEGGHFILFPFAFTH
jgi:hypothetical protein